MSYSSGAAVIASVEEEIPAPTSGSDSGGGELHHRVSTGDLDNSDSSRGNDPVIIEENMAAVDLSDDNYQYGLNNSQHSHGSGRGTSNRIGNISTSLGVTLPKKKSGIFGSSANMVNSIVGAGIIGIPYAFKQSGLIAGLLLLLLVAYLTNKSLRIIVELASFQTELSKIGVYTYEDLASFAFGKIGSGFVLFNMFILAYGAMVSYMIIIKDTVPTILGWDNGIEREIVLIVFTLVIVLPLSIQRDMASLAFSSLLSVTADVILCIFITAYAPIHSTVSEQGGFGDVLKNDSVNSTIFIGLGILSTAMACQHSAFIVSNSLYNKTQKRWGTVTFYSITLSGILCAWLGTAGYLGFLQDTQGNILNNFDANSLVANAARTLLAITMFFTYPMESFVARHVLIKLVHNGEMEPETKPQRIDDDGMSEHGNGITMNGGDHSVAVEVTTTAPQPFFGLWTRRVKWSLGLYGMSLVPALFIDDLGPVLSITGSIGGSCISYIAPGMLYLGIHGDAFMEWTNNILKNYNNKSSSKDRTDGDIELPVAGDSKQVMQTTEENVREEQEQSTNGGMSTMPVFTGPESKPWWWFIALMPLWVAIASTGSHNMKKKIIHMETIGRVNTSGAATNVEGAVSGGGDNTIDIVHSTKKDFVIAMFFVLFGLLAFACGLLSNIYIIINDIFFSPH